MKSVLGSFMALATVFLILFGLLSVFEVFPSEVLGSWAGKFMLGIGVILAGALALKGIGTSSTAAKGKDGEPPPVL